MTTAAPDTLLPSDLFAAAELADESTPPAPSRFVVGVDDAALPPASTSARIAHNLTVVRLLADLRRRGGPPTHEEKVTLSRWAGWGAVPELFDETLDRYATQRAQLIALLGPDGYAAARRTTINAHYTDPADRRRPCGRRHRAGLQRRAGAGARLRAGDFIGPRPDGAHVTGVELDPTTAAIAAALYPDADILRESFADTRGPRGHASTWRSATCRSATFALHDRRHNAGGHSIHNHFIIKSLRADPPRRRSSPC